MNCCKYEIDEREHDIPKEKQEEDKTDVNPNQFGRKKSQILLYILGV